MSGRLTGKVVFITGGVSGLGAGVVQRCLEEDAAVWIGDLQRPTPGSPAASAHWLEMDVRQEADWIRALDAVQAHDGRLDVLVNNAGGFGTQRTTEEMSLEEWQKLIHLNLTSVFMMSSAAVPMLRKSEAGRIINIGSLAGQLTSYRTSPPYAAAKAGVHSLTRVMASELAAEGITVNAIAPSAVLTERIIQLRDEDERAATALSIPMGRYQQTDELATWILFLATAEAGFATGQTIGVNGGRYMG
jgi:NAD(P)-dependent dehydrogenase (short-subunit alcohol dehydrogenase family)